MIIASGDLAEDGSLGSYRRLRELLIATDVPVFVLPGNHDTVANMTDALVGDAIKMERLHTAGGWKFVFINSQIPGQSYGRVTGEALNFLQSELQADPETPFLVALHHPPIAPCPHPICQLEAAADFLTTLGKYPNAKAVISGHAHLENMTELDQLKVMTTPATCAQARHGVTPTSDEQAWGVQDGLAVAYDDFKATHKVDPTRHGYRILDLSLDGNFTTEVLWVTNSESHSAVK